MSADRYLLDANVLFYAIDTSGGIKHDIADKLLRYAMFEDCIFTVQTLAETYNAISRRRPALVADAREVLDELTIRATVVSASAEDFLEALQLHERRPVHFWDGMLWATARRHGCTTILTEDMQHRPLSGGVRYLNPFASPSDPDLVDYLPA